MLQSPVSPHLSPRKGWFYRQPETGVEFRVGSLNALKTKVAKHRGAMKLDLSHGWWHRLLDQICQQNPNVRCQDNREAEGWEPHYAVTGRALWKELHERAEQPPTSDLESWFLAWLQRCPNFSGCRCRENAILILQTMQIRYDEGFRQFCIDFHNRVSATIGKPQWPH